jgi:outer membrane protein W
MKNLFLLAICMLVMATVFSQGKKGKLKNFNRSNKAGDVFLQKQWWLGFKAGPNLSKATLETAYNVISPTNYDVAGISKTYKNFNLVGTQATFELTFYFKGISVSFQPTYRHNRFEYTNEFEWLDSEQTNNRLVLNYEQTQKTAYLDLPLILKYEFDSEKIKPYIQFGYYSAMMLDATKSVTISGTDYASGGVNNFQNEPIVIGATDLFAKYHWGFATGGGVNYNLGNVRLNFDVIYKIGMSNISSTKNRYGSDRLSGVGDSLDDIKLNTLAVSVGCLFPLRFLGSGFKSVDGR